MKYFFISLLFGWIISMNAAEPVLLKDSVLECDGWRGIPTTFSKDWQTWTTVNHPRIFKLIKSSENLFKYHFDLPGGGIGILKFTLKDGHLNGVLDMKHGSLIRTLCLASTLPISLYAGNKIEIDGKLHTLPNEFEKEAVFDGIVKRLRFSTKTGEILLEGDFHLRIQDGRKWDGIGFGIRIGFLSSGKVGKAKLSFRIRHGKSGEFGEKLGFINRQPYISRANENWKPFVYHRNVQQGSALDFSARLDAPSGKYGPVILNSDGHFVFRDRPDVPVRFYGPNLVGDSLLPDKRTAHEIAERFASFGFNAVRFHQQDNELYRHSYPLGKTESAAKESLLNPERMDRFDYLIHCMKKRGIYYTTDLYASRRNIPETEIPGVAPFVSVAEYKALLYINEHVYANWLRWAKEFLGHVNPYTGLAMKDDPSLIALVLVNEANPANVWRTSARSEKLYKESFQKWKKKNPDRNFDRFISFIAISRYKRMKKDLLEFGVHARLSDQNFKTKLALTEARGHYDFIDNHLYWDHPRFAEKNWQLPATPNQKNAIASSPGSLACLFPTRQFGKPFTITEFDYANPNIYRAAGPSLMAAYAAFQDWDALFPFAYSHSNASVVDPKRTSGFFDIATDPIKSFSQRIGANLFLSGGITPAKQTIAAVATDPFHKNGNEEAPNEFAELGFLARIGSAANLPVKADALVEFGCGTDTGRKIPVFQANNRLLTNLIKAKILPETCFDAANRRFLSPGNELELNHGSASLRVTSPGAEVLVTGKLRNLNGKFLNVKDADGYAVFALLPLDTVSLDSARRLTLFHLTNTQASGMRFGNSFLDLLETWGETPFLAKRGRASIFIDLPGEWNIYALDSDGSRIGEFRYTGTGSGIRLELDNFQFQTPVFAYEIVRR